MMRPTTALAEDEAMQLKAILERSATLREVHRLVTDFAGLVRHRPGRRHLDTWIAKTQATGVSHLKRFADGLIKDYDAVRNALTTN